MTHETLMREKRYLACLAFLRGLKERSLLTESEYTQARQLLIDRYQPKISLLFE